MGRKVWVPVVSGPLAPYAASVNLPSAICQQDPRSWPQRHRRRGDSGGGHYRLARNQVRCDLAPRCASSMIRAQFGPGCRARSARSRHCYPGT